MSDYVRGLPFGHPPFLPFSRAAAVLASERTLPPRRPKATAAGFLRGIGVARDAFREDSFSAAVAVDDALVEQFHDRHVVVFDAGQVAAAAGRVQISVARPARRGGDSDSQISGLGCHAPIRPNRLGIVKWTK